MLENQSMNFYFFYYFVGKGVNKDHLHQNQLQGLS